MASIPLRTSGRSHRAACATRLSKLAIAIAVLAPGYGQAADLVLENLIVNGGTGGTPTGSRLDCHRARCEGKRRDRRRLLGHRDRRGGQRQWPSHDCDR
ncbi:hypothetical protein [Burkholderia contaminans]|uniref:hypothetical protein n=1 Tax=Burkholderia contaminans TaxID=488447 RepID=UPI003D66895B